MSEQVASNADLNPPEAVAPEAPSAPPELFKKSEPAEAAAVEAAPEVEAEPTDVEKLQSEIDARQKKLASGFTALSKQESEFRRKEQEYKDKIAALESFDAKKQNFLNDPLEALNEMAKSAGIDNGYDYITKKVLGDDGAEKAQQGAQHAAKMQDLEQKLQSQTEQLQKYQQHQEVEQYKTQVASAMSPDDHPYLTGLNRESFVYDVVQAHYNETQELLSADEAVRVAEEYVKQDAQELMKTLVSIPGQKETIQELIQALASEGEEIKETVAAQDTPKAKTKSLTNKASATRSPKGDTDSSKLSEEESIERAASFIQFR